MENKINIYDFKDQPIRIIDRDGEPWFVAADVCRVLEIGNVSHAVSRLHEDEKGIASNDTLGGKQQLIIISESGLYALIFTSRKPEAQEFRKWVTHEVLPAIRKTGQFDINDASALPAPAPEPDIQWTSVLGYLERVRRAKEWTLRQMIYFGLTVRRASKAFGIEWRTAPDQRFGHIQVVPISLLHFVMRESLKHPETRIELKERELQDVGCLIEALGDTLSPGETRELTFNDLVDAAKKLGLFENLGLNSGPVDQRVRSVVGKQFSRASGKQFGDLRFKARNTGRYRKFVLHREEASF
jgi:prophage antirepressor-like protein